MGLHRHYGCHVFSKLAYALLENWRHILTTKKVWDSLEYMEEAKGNQKNPIWNYLAIFRGNHHRPVLKLAQDVLVYCRPSNSKFGLGRFSCRCRSCQNQFRPVSETSLGQSAQSEPPFSRSDSKLFQTRGKFVERNLKLFPTGRRPPLYLYVGITSD